MNFRDERQHDKLMMALIKGLDSAGRLDVLEQKLGLPTLGTLKSLRHRQAFDVEAVFRERKLMIETKVDSDEGGRWAAIDNSAAWQTNRLKALATNGDVCLFVTYGFAEFFTKWFDFGSAAGTSQVHHVTLDAVIALLELALPLLSDPLLDEWLLVLRAEQLKRKAIPELLAAFALFRRRYLQISGDVDFTRTRIGFNAPEVAFPAFARVLDEWRKSHFCKRYGRLALYPVGRMMLPVDSILNWWEFWHSGDLLTLGGLLPTEPRGLYFEVNEDFNLHLKFRAELPQHVEQVRAEVANRFSTVAWPSAVVANRPECHFQGTYAVWEWDLDLPARIFASGDAGAVNALGTLLDEVVPLLA
ncbi:MAG: hypothetical protein ACRYGM_15990 [Janthinobacterium lividum]